MRNDFHRRAHFGLAAAYIATAAILLAEGALAHGCCALAVALLYAAVFLYA